ncbi:unnamed protein product [Lupinus luteus]|uniref:Carboxypeptidase n=1 Tax=Lupinus luteus TaxID=3873 RepID=A0AAV1Y512_LUPLU
MEKLFHSATLLLLFLGLLFHGGMTIKSEDGLEEWDYVEVRPKAHMFWWLYKSPYRVENPSKPWPIILWLQGGPGASGVGIGNFQEIGPLDTFLKPRNSTWLKKADLLFVDNPVGTGYSYVDDDDLYVKTDEDAATDLTTLLINIFNKDKTLQKSPLFILAESYGGKYAVTLGLSVFKAIKEKRLNLILGGVALGNSWISPEDSVFSWGPLLKDLSRIDENGLQASDSVAQKIKQQIQDGKFVDATGSWSLLENIISMRSNNVDFYNLLRDSGSGSIASSTMEPELFREISEKRYSNYLSSSPGGKVDLSELLNGPIKKKLKIIPENVTWGGQSNKVFSVLQGDFMKPRINEVDELLANGVNVTVYSGQVDLICATKGTEAWIRKLKWEGLKTFLGKSRTALYCEKEPGTKGFYRSHKNLNFYWILGAGHFVPTDQPCLALDMVAAITNSPAARK